MSGANSSDSAYDLVVVGGGQAGCAAALRASDLGLRVALVEKRHAGLGGAFVHEERLPFAVWWEAASLLEAWRRAQTLGVQAGDAPQLVVEALAERRRSMIADFARSSRELLTMAGVEVFAGRAYCAGPRTVMVLDPDTGDELESLDARHVLVATGTRPQPLEGFERDGRLLLGTADALALESVPRSMICVGSGPEACNLALLFSILGCRVTLLSDAARLLPGADAAVSDFVERRLESLGCPVVQDCSFAQAEAHHHSGHVLVTTSDGEDLEADCAVCCAGRVPATGRLGLRKLGVQSSPVDGGVLVDAGLETACAGVFAAGGVLEGGAAAGTARAQGITAAERIAGVREPGRGGPSTTLAAITTMALAAWVGLGEEDARASGVEISVGVAPLEENTAAILRNDTDGFVKVVADRATGEILGVHFAGAGATEAVATAALAMRQELTVDDLADQAAPMPSLAKALEVAARAAGTRRRRT